MLQTEEANSEIQAKIIKPNLLHNLDYSKSYNELSDAQKEMLDTILSNMDFTSMYGEFFGDNLAGLMDYLITYIIEPLGDEGHIAFQEAMAKVFTLDKDSISYSDYMGQMNESIKKVASQISGMDMFADKDSVEYKQKIEEYKQYLETLEKYQIESKKEFSTEAVNLIGDVNQIKGELKGYGLLEENGTTQDAIEVLKNIINGTTDISAQANDLYYQIINSLSKFYGIDEESYATAKQSTIDTLISTRHKTAGPYTFDEQTQDNEIKKAINDFIDNELNEYDFSLLQQNIPIGFEITDNPDEVAAQLQKIIDDAKKKINANVGFNLSDYQTDYEAASEQISKYQSAYQKVASGVMTDSDKLELINEMPDLLPYINDTEKLKQKLEELSKSSVTEMLAELNQDLADMKANGADEKAIENIKTYITLIEKLGASVSEISVSDAMENVQSAYKTLDDLKDEIKDSGRATAFTFC